MEGMHRSQLFTDGWYLVERNCAMSVIVRTNTSQKKPRDKLTPVQQEFLFRTLNSEALSKFKQNQESSITFGEALEFWGCPSMRGNDLIEYLKEEDKCLGDCWAVLSRNSAILKDGRAVTFEDTATVAQVARYIVKHFKGAIAAMSQVQERKR